MEPILDLKLSLKWVMPLSVGWALEGTCEWGAMGRKAGIGRLRGE